MHNVTLRSKALSFALSAGVVAFVLAICATFHGRVTVPDIAQAFVPAVVCAAFCWASTTRALADTAAAMDSAIVRLTRAADGDLLTPIPNEIGAAVPQLGTAMERLFRQLDANLDTATQMALFDPVTGLANRTHFRQQCEVALGDMPAGRIAALMFIDLDRFKAVNDTLGHAAGDMLLAAVAGRLRALTQGTGEWLAAPLIGRLAGDEFTIFMPHLGSVAAVETLARAVLAAINEPFVLPAGRVEIGASIGIATRPDHGRSLTDLMRAADAAMYQAKGAGRGRAEFFSSTLAAELAERSVLEGELLTAVQQGQFALMFQPQVSLASGRVVGAEALLRWQHPSGEMRLPGSFIQRAEETGLIVEIGEWVVETVAETIARWGRMGIEQRLAINVSPRQLVHAAFFHRLRDALRDTRAPTRLLELELTETLAMRCGPDLIDAIAALRADGATIALDDFGTGYSNLGRLCELPLDRIKLDHALTRHVADRAEARAVAQAVIGLAHGIGCEVVAEGIETRAQADLLRVIGCDVVQGYAIARPMEEAAFLSWSRDATTPVAISA